MRKDLFIQFYRNVQCYEDFQWRESPYVNVGRLKEAFNELKKNGDSKLAGHPTQEQRQKLTGLIRGITLMNMGRDAGL